MNQVSSSINIENLRNAFSFHVKCGEIYYLQPVNEVLIICNICNNENFDKYENFLQHFEICYKKSKKQNVDIDEFLNGGIKLKTEMDLHIMDIAPPQLSESDDDEEDNPIKTDATNGPEIIIPTIEINDSESDSEKCPKEPAKVTKPKKSSMKAKKTEFKGSDETVEIGNSNNISQKMDVESSLSTSESVEKKKRKVSFAPIEFESYSAQKAEKRKLESMEKQSTSNEFAKMPVEFHPKKLAAEAENKEPPVQIVEPPAANFGEMLPHITTGGDYPPNWLANLSNFKPSMNPKYMKSDKRPHQCPGCGKCFAQRINLVIHFRTHTGEKPYKCTMCDNAYPQKSNLDAHMLKHTGIRPFGCEDCGKRFFQMSHLLAHERTHTGERPYKCADCDRSFAQGSHLTSHIRNTHSNEQIHQCAVCKMVFADETLLSQHQITHLNETILNYNEIMLHQQSPQMQNPPNQLQPIQQIPMLPQLPLAQQLQAMQHLQSIKPLTPEQLQKLQQQQQVQDSNTLLNNKTSPVKEAEDQAKRFECTLCDKKFYQSNHLAMHQRTHSTRNKEIPTSTKLKFKFNKQNTLGMKRKHECDDCGKKFALVTELKVHQRKKH